MAMENPSKHQRQRLQRHSSLPPRIQKHATRLQRRRSSTTTTTFRPPPLRPSRTTPHRLPNKLNPYVGWFRHAPDTSFFLQKYRLSNSSGGKRSRRHTTASCSLADMKNSPYIGWFRHAPPSSSSSRRLLHLSKDKLHKLDYEFMVLFQRLSREHTKQSTVVSPTVCGYLPGGAPGSSASPSTLAYGDYPSYHSAEEGTPSATVKVLTRLASWFLFPLAHDAESCGYRHDLHDEKLDHGSSSVLPHLFPYSIRHAILEEDECSSSSSSNDTSMDSGEDDSSIDTIVPNDHVNELPPNELNISVSSLAEAYYTHQAAKELDRQSSVSYDATPDGGEEDDGQRLDYVITQMDIARMARNASRHLDVASILSLPTITYHQSDDDDSQSVSNPPPQSQRQQQQDTNPDDPGWSWMIVHDGQSPPEEQIAPKARDTDVCVICLDHFVDGDRLRVLPCGHSFHVGCIDRWLSGSSSFEDTWTSGCPTCKKRAEPALPAADDDDDNGAVPSWAFTRIGESLAKNSVMTL